MDNRETAIGLVYEDPPSLGRDAQLTRIGRPEVLRILLVAAAALAGGIGWLEPHSSVPQAGSANMGLHSDGDLEGSRPISTGGWQILGVLPLLFCFVPDSKDTATASCAPAKQIQKGKRS